MAPEPRGPQLTNGNSEDGRFSLIEGIALALNSVIWTMPNKPYRKAVHLAEDGRSTAYALTAPCGV